MARSWLVAFTLLASCGFPRPARQTGDAAAPDSQGSGIDAPLTCPDCQLVAINPPIANTGQLVTLEGTFGATADVVFPGGAHVTPTMLGAHRATVLVPASATTGPLTVTSGGATTSVAFRRASFQLGVSRFYPDDQTATARLAPVMNQARRAHAAAVLGGYLYVFGGEDANGAAIGTVERAMVNVDGTLQPFTQVGTLAVPRRYAASVVLGGTVYLIGGLDAAGQRIAGVEAASIQTDGSLGAFATVPGVTLSDPRMQATAEVIGNYVYVIGGADVNGSTTMVERAPINAGGRLDTFVVATGTSLQMPRSLHTSAVIGNGLYVVGGENNGNLTASIERAPIADDGTLGAFVHLVGTLQYPREGHSSFVLGDHLYLVGGAGAGGTSSIESAAIDASGMLGAFGAAGTWSPGSRQLTPMLVVGNYIYATGGKRFNQAETTVERANIDASGGLGTAAVDATSVSGYARNGCSAVIGNHIYLVGGSAMGSQLDIVQSAPIDADGVVGGFTVLPGRLMLARESAACAVIGNYLYVVGGINVQASPRILDSIERSPIQPDGTLGAFETIANHLAMPRAGHRVLVLQRELYVFGGIAQIGGPGTGNEMITNTMEVSNVAADASLGVFQVLSVTMTGAGRANFVAANLGQWIYLIGGNDPNGQLATADYLILNNNGVIGGNMSPAPIQLATPRESFTMAVIGSQLFAIGGFDVSAGLPRTLNTIEQATLMLDGQVGAFPGSPTGGTLSGSRSGHVSGIVGNHAFHVAGADFNSELSTIDQSVLP